jgi:hypothetical protein
MSLEKLGADKKKLREGFPGFRLEVGSPGQKDELLARKEAFHCASWPFQLLLSDLIDGLEKVANDVKLVIDNLSFRTMGQKALPERLPHVHDGVCHLLGTFFSEPFPERL